MLKSIFSQVNNSRTISKCPFSTAALNAVLLNSINNFISKQNDKNIIQNINIKKRD